MEKKLKSETIFNGDIIHVTYDDVELEDGKKAKREVVYHRGGVCILAIEDGCILLVKQYRYPHACDTLEIPAGKLEEGEDRNEACFREFEEETDRRAKKMNFILKLLPTPGYSSEVDYLYEAVDFKHVDDSKPADDDEFLKVIKVPLEKAYAMVLNGEIVDAKTQIAILYAYSQKKSL